MPTSHEFILLPPSCITIPPRIREANDTEGTSPEDLAKGLDALQESIKRVGLLHPIVIDRNHELIAGFRRLTVHLRMNAPTIACQYVNLLTDDERHIIELEENIRRKDFAWEERIKGVRDYHRRMQTINPAWSQASTAEALGMSTAHVSKFLTVADEGDRDPTVYHASGPTAAYKRVAASTQRGIDRELARSLHDPIIEEPEKPYEIQQADFLEWAPHYTGVPFNFIHCDFPYGINLDKSKMLGKGVLSRLGKYGDSPDVYWALLTTFIEHRERLLAPNAWIMFWLSMQHHHTTRQAFTEGGFNVYHTPLTWVKSCGSGLVPDPMRTPRLTTEFALLVSWGDPHQLRAVNNGIAYPKDNDAHPSVKPAPMLSHFFRAWVDGHSRVLDPTCGSGASIRAAAELGAEYALGLELNPEYASHAADRLKIAIQSHVEVELELA